MHEFVESLIVAIDWSVGLAVVVLTAWLVLNKAIRNALERYLTRRQAAFETVIRRALFQDPEAWDAIRLERWGDRRVLWRIFAHVAENFSGEITMRMARRLESMGFLQEAVDRLESRAWWVRAEAAHHLGLLKDPAAEPLLLAALRDRSEDVGLAASRALARIKGCDALPPILARYAAQWGSPSLDVASVLYEMGPETSPYLLRILPTLARGSQLLAIDILGYFKDPHAVKDLALLVRSPDAEVRARAVKALGQIGHPDALPTALEAAEDPAEAVRLLACGALARWGGRQSIQALVRRLEDPSLQVRLRAAQALSLMGAVGNRALEKARRKASPIVRRILEQYLQPEGVPS